MRVISGTHRGRKLKEPANLDIRPTSDMVKESIFNMVQFDMEGRNVLDLFAGTGQLGIEALSRGAKNAVFVDASAQGVKIVKENLAACGFENARVVNGDAISYLARCEKFDMIFLDPPYDTALIDSALAKIIEFDILKENGIIICETKVDKQLPELAPPYEVVREYKYGKIKITKITKS